MRVTSTCDTYTRHNALENTWFSIILVPFDLHTRRARSRVHMRTTSTETPPLNRGVVVRPTDPLPCVRYSQSNYLYIFVWARVKRTRNPQGLNNIVVERD